VNGKKKKKNKKKKRKKKKNKNKGKDKQDEDASPTKVEDGKISPGQEEDASSEFTLIKNLLERILFPHINHDFSEKKM
jgi:hypothetical protein